MDGDRFDGITRLLAAGVGRRRVTRGLAAALLGGLALPPDALAACKKVGK